MWVYVNGDFVPADQARLPVSDRGFRFGDGLFETIQITDGKPLFWKRHLKRLHAGLEALQIPAPKADLTAKAAELLQRNSVRDAVLRIAVSRGSGSQGYLPLECAEPTLLLETLPLPAPSDKGISLWLSKWKRPSPAAMPVNFKLAQGLTSTLARMEAQQHECDEALLCSESGYLAEAASSNLFWISNGHLHTPSLESGALAGVAREIILERWPQPVQQGLYPLQTLREADIVFISNTISGLRVVETLQPQNWRWKINTQSERQLDEFWQTQIRSEPGWPE